MELIKSLFNWFAANPGATGVIVAGSLFIAVLYALAIFAVIARVAPDYFVASRPTAGTWRNRHPVLRITFHVLKNLLGLGLLVAGIAMLVLPGQGLLTILIAIGFLDFPGKRSMERQLVSQPKILSVINRIRERAGSPPLIMPDG